MRTPEILLYLQSNHITVFATSDIAKIIGKRIEYARKIVSTIPGIKMAERGIYYTNQADIYEIASNVVLFSYVSMLSALRYYDLTTQIPHIIDVVSPKAHRRIEVEGYEIRFIKLKPARIFGHVRRGNAFIAAPEKAILDCLYTGEYAYLEEAFNIGFENGLISMQKLIDYSLKFKSKSLINKLGFFLETFAGQNADILLKYKSSTPVRLINGANKYNKKWGVYYGE